MDRIINMIVSQITRLLVRKGIDAATKGGAGLLQKAKDRKRPPTKQVPHPEDEAERPRDPK